MHFAGGFFAFALIGWFIVACLALLWLLFCGVSAFRGGCCLVRVVVLCVLIGSRLVMLAVLWFFEWLVGSRF